MLHLWAKRRFEEQSLETQRKQEKAAVASVARNHHDDSDMSWIQPVYRASPYAAEARRAQRSSAQASILFVDEGNHCR